jgi:hypothetical protein
MVTFSNDDVRRLNGDPASARRSALAPRIEVYRLDPRAGAYRHVATYRRGDRVTTPLLPGLVIDVAEIFG